MNIDSISTMPRERFSTQTPIARTLMFTCAIVAYFAGAATAQSRIGRGPVNRIPVTVKIEGQNARPLASPVIFRKVGEPGENLIVLPASQATPQALVSAAITLEVLMTADGDWPSKPGEFKVNYMDRLPKLELAVAERVLDRMKRASPAAGPNVDAAMTGMIYLPDSSLRQRQASTGKILVHRRK